MIFLNKNIFLSVFLIVSVFGTIVPSFVSGKDTLRIVLIRPKLILCKILHKDSLFTRLKLEQLEFRNGIKKLTEKHKSLVITVGIDHEADPQTAILLFEDLNALKIKNFPTDNVTETEKEAAYRQFSIEDLFREKDLEPVSKEPPVALNILVFSAAKLIWYDDKEFPFIHVEDFSPNLLGDLANRYRNQPIYLKFDPLANTSLSKLIINELNRLEVLNYEFEQVNDKERKIVNSLIQTQK